MKQQGHIGNREEKLHLACNFIQQCPRGFRDRRKSVFRINDPGQRGIPDFTRELNGFLFDIPRQVLLGQAAGPWQGYPDFLRRLGNPVLDMHIDVL